MFSDNYHMRVDHIDATELFPNTISRSYWSGEEKKIIGNTFIEVFESEAKNSWTQNFLFKVLYPDVIESVSLKVLQLLLNASQCWRPSDRMNLKLIEPLNFSKDEVRNWSRAWFTWKYLFAVIHSWSGLAVRVLGEITMERLRHTREADDIFIKELTSKDLW